MQRIFVRSNFILISVLLAYFLGCQNPPEGALFDADTGTSTSTQRITVSNIQAGALAISYYDLDGKLLGVFEDYSLQNISPRGIAKIDNQDFVVSFDGGDQIKRYSLQGETKYTISNGFLTGNIYMMAADASRVYVIETNAIEAFGVNDQVRVGNPYITTPLGSCVLSTPRGMTINSAGNLVVVGTGNDDLNVYDVSTGTPTCVTSNTTMGNIDPVDVIAHSDGSLYVVTQVDDAVWKFSGDGTGAGTQIYRPA